MLTAKRFNEARFIHRAIIDLSDNKAPRVLDFGCGTGTLVDFLRQQRIEAWGCDHSDFRSGDFAEAPYLKTIALVPYRLPFDDQSFDVVVSTSVLEHAANKPTLFREIFRVLRPGGVMLHLFPAKWYIPVEPHIYVPLANWFWPYAPRWWLELWAILGIRNEFQQGMGWRETAAANASFCRDGIHYWTHHHLAREVTEIFGNCDFPDLYFLAHSPGGGARVARRLPFQSVAAWFLGRFRMELLRARKGCPNSIRGVS